MLTRNKTCTLRVMYKRGFERIPIHARTHARTHSSTLDTFPFSFASKAKLFQLLSEDSHGFSRWTYSISVDVH